MKVSVRANRFHHDHASAVAHAHARASVTGVRYRVKWAPVHMMWSVLPVPADPFWVRS